MSRMIQRSRAPLLYLFLCLAARSAVALAQTPAAPQGGTAIRLPDVIVNAQKEAADAQALPVSLTALTKDWLALTGAATVTESGAYAPNAYFSEFSARKLSNARFRGIGSSPANPGITTYFDGVPQLNTNTSNIDLLDIEQVEFVRGPQSALFGRNTLGGLINVASARPSLSRWTGSLATPFANRDAREVRGNASGPLIADRLGMGVSLAYSRRDGFTTNDLTGHDLDRRSGLSGKAQLLWTPSSLWETRVIFTGERARDGDYALSDLGGLRRTPFHTARDFEGHTDRDLTSTTVLARREGSRVSLSSTTGIVRWKTHDATDLDYTPVPLITRDNAEEATQFTQEIRLASAAVAPLALGRTATLKWQAGLFLFTQDYEQDAVNAFAPGVISQFLPFPISQHSPQSALDDFGVGFYGQGTATLAGTVDLSLGARMDHERKEAVLDTYYTPAIAAPRHVASDRSFSNISPQASVGVRVQPGKLLYAAAGRGFKAGGFNPASPAGNEAYAEEHTWNIEGGLKTAWAGGRVVANASVFHINWDDMQLNLPDPAVPGQFYIANVGGATSRGVELEVIGRARQGVDVFGQLGYTHARFKDGSVSSGANVAGKDVPNTPEYTATLGTQLSHAVRQDVTIFGRAELVLTGTFKYDDLNLEGQDAYSLANLRAGARSRYLFAEAWVKNAFDTRYVPVAFAYGPFAPSGFIGEMGRPRTFGVTGGVTF